eukprot:765199-Hanusia_phi.AAC.1
MEMLGEHRKGQASVLEIESHGDSSDAAYQFTLPVFEAVSSSWRAQSFLLFEALALKPPASVSSSSLSSWLDSAPRR